jgi:hypothetical protein
MNITPSAILVRYKPLLFFRHSSKVVRVLSLFYIRRYLIKVDAPKKLQIEFSALIASLQGEVRESLLSKYVALKACIKLPFFSDIFMGKITLVRSIFPVNSYAVLRKIALRNLWNEA